MMSQPFVKKAEMPGARIRFAHLENRFDTKLEIPDLAPCKEIRAKKPISKPARFRAKLETKTHFRLNGLSTIDSPINSRIILNIKTLSTNFFYTLIHIGYRLNQELNKYVAINSCC